MPPKKNTTIARELVDEHWPGDVPVQAILRAAGPERRAEIEDAVGAEFFRRDTALIDRCEGARPGWGSGAAAARALYVLRRSWVKWKGGVAAMPPYIRASALAHLRVRELEDGD